MIYSFLVILFIHWLADFVLQSDQMARGKSKDSWILFGHAFVHYLLLLILVPGLLVLTSHLSGSPLKVGDNYSSLSFGFALTNTVLHFITDYVTSRVSSKLWSECRTHEFFVVVGLDQLIHQVCLAFTMVWFFY